ncbi:putative ABC transport system ATP-binding protein [Ekhidna lutea]|uniref:Putative ABC transport system ATP-binding protein n=1 Tax=Ekhidna lutea TaxID=447679 RepID=A0A239KDQ8_EKHLU|nr:ABC transporter ATP-binding protein [Ekhidna lutea]SNT16487.1 putative ABC transport system ATP-binding protein [Ekhidna lutea]
MLQIKGLKHSYDGNPPIDYPDWDVKKGNHAIIIGNSGCGKTTLLHLIGGLMPPKEGTLVVAGENLAEKPKSKLDRFRGENIGIIFQKPHLVKALSVKENLMLSQYLGQKKTDSKRAEEVLDSLGIADLASRKIHQISQGQAQRVSIARAVINSPALLLADEPTASLDDENCQKVIDLLKSQAEETGATLIVATHDHRVKSEFKNQLTL